MRIGELSKAAWLAILRWTALLMLISVSVSVLATHIILSTLSQGMNGPGLAAAIALPILLGGPTSFWHLVRLQQLKLANQKLQVLASTDWLTSCLNRRAFTHAVSDQLQPARLVRTAGQSALLVIDADHFKLINDVYGHDRGDDALQLLAAIIRSKAREGDLVGRIGGEEFGVFLKGANLEVASLVAERIRKAINRAVFAPDGFAHRLSASIGGAVFEGEIGFSELFRIADQRLYEAKQAGRNRVEIGRIADHGDVHRQSHQLRLTLAGAG